MTAKKTVKRSSTSARSKTVKKTAVIHAHTKRCAKCGKRKEMTSFHKCSDSGDGRQGYCKSCKAAYMRNYSR